ncbi:MAG: hypothetical protein RLZZ111_1099 [Planctomycetota bacterium]
MLAVVAIWLPWAALTPRPGLGATEPSGARSGLPELVRTKHRTFSIPFRLPAAKDADAEPQRVLLNVSKDLGGTWEQAGEVAPSAGSFTYQAGPDGEYWFRLRAIDGKGRARGGEGPDMRVLVDAAGPRLAARVWKGADGEILCRYAAADDSIRMESLKVEYRVAGEQGWKTVAAQGVLARESPAHLVGEEIWWAGEKVGQLTVQITVSDSAGNQTVKQYSMEPSDPQIDQTALAQEIGVPGLPAASSVPTMTAHSPLPTSPSAATGGGRTNPGWTAEPAAAWSAEQPQTPASLAQPGDMQSVLVSRLGGTPPTEAAAASGLSLSPAAPGSRSAAAGQPLPQSLDYRGKPLQLLRSRRFAWDYEVPTERLHGARVRVELWSTRDGGLSWQKTAVDDDDKSPINVVLPAAGLYGFRLEVVSDLPDSSPGPRPGEAAESWVGIDEEQPHVELIDVARPPEADASGVVIRYTSRDALPAPNTARLLFSPSADGPWATIAAGIENQGEYRWQPDRATPARVYVRVEVADAAGNVGAATSPEPVTVSTARIVGRLGGVRTLPATP